MTIEKYVDRSGIAFIWSVIKETFSALNHSHISKDITDLKSVVSSEVAEYVPNNINRLIVDSGGIINPINLPSYVDDVVEAIHDTSLTPSSDKWLLHESSLSVIVPERDKIYVLVGATSAVTDDEYLNTQYRWSGTQYIKLNDGGVTPITNEQIDAICI